MHKRTAILSFSALVCLAACAAAPESGAPPPEAEGDVASPLAAAEAAEGPAAGALASSVAGALRDGTLRRALRYAMRASRVKEGKLHLQSYLRGEGRGLLTAMSAASRVTEDGLARSLDQMGPLEIYLPVGAHRAAWAGGDELIVATQPREQ